MSRYIPGAIFITGQTHISTSERYIVSQIRITTDLTVARADHAKMAEQVSIESLRSYLCTSEETLPVTIGKSSFDGRGLFATKKLKKGSLIFINKPMATGPRADSVAETFCSNCYKICNKCYPCEKCYAFVCSNSCNNSTDHLELCAFVLNNWILKYKIDSEVSKTLNRVLLYLKFLLLSKEQKLLLNIFQKSNPESSFEELDLLLAKYIIPDEHIEFIKTINAIMKTNSFRLSDDSNEKKIRLRGLYPLSAFMNHNCVPNTRNVFKNDYTMAVYATKDIEIGDEISSCYTGLLWCSPARRCQLYKSKKFWCKCKRCMDVTEMGTKLSALKCLRTDCIGDILPKDPLDPRSSWLCDICGTSVSADRINNIQSVLGSLVGALELDNEFRMENVVIQRLAVFIPYTNHIFVDIQLRLAIRLGFKGGRDLNGINKRKCAYGLTKLTPITQLNVAIFFTLLNLTSLIPC